MFLFLVFLVYSTTLPFNSNGETIIKSIMEGTESPFFMSNEEDLNANKNDGARYNVDATISDTSYRISFRRDSEFYFSSVTIQNTNFHETHAFGIGVGFGSGGAIFLSYCTMLAIDTEFVSCEASNGGATCSLCSLMCIERCKFIGDMSFRFGGSIYFQGGFKNTNNYSPGNAFLCYNSEFTSNVASEYGGALSFSMAVTVYLENCKITGNSAGYNGAGLYSCNSEFIKIFNSQILSNKLEFSSYLNNNSRFFHYNMHSNLETPDIPAFSIRGGAGVCVVADYVFQSTFPTSTFYSQGNCYGGNSAGSHAITKGNGPGHAILLDGNCQLQSLNDNFGSTKQFNNIISKAGPLTEYPVLVNYVEIPTDCGEMADNSEIDREEIDTVNISNTGNMFLTSFVPPPTTFVLPATPFIKFQPNVTAKRDSTWIGQFTTLSMKSISRPTEISTKTRLPTRSLFSGWYVPPESFEGPSTKTSSVLVLVHSSSSVLFVSLSGSSFIVHGTKMSVVVYRGTTSTTVPVTNDNPLWTTSIAGDVDDPFKNDFEEEYQHGFFNIKDTGIE